MITKVSIKNFQSHKQTEFEFVEGTNVIIGESDTGKSAIFNAIRWVTSNRPLGDAFRSEWGGDTSVTIYTSDGHVVERVRTASRNDYIVDGVVLGAFGSEVPTEVTDVLQIDSYNIQAQFDMPFLIFNTPGEVARILNKAASLDDIDRTIAGLRSSLSQITSETKHAERLISKYFEEMRQYDGIDALEARLAAIEDSERRLAQEESDLETLNRLIDKIASIEDKLSVTEHLAALAERMTAVENKHSKYKEQAAMHERLSQLVERIQDIEASLSETEHIDAALARLSKTETSISTLKELKERSITLRRLVSEIVRTTNAIERADKEIKRLADEYKRLMPDTCPLCGAAMRKKGDA